ncbi:hypothetical protein COL154_014212, partial [Colletotrichum chrysophilum]
MKNRLRHAFFILLGIGWAAAATAPAAAADALPTLPMSKAIHDMLPADIKAAGKITLATDAHYPTCESFAADGKTMVGFEPDLWNAMAQVLGVRIVPSSIEFASVIPGISGGRYDTAMACISDRPAREKQVTFIDYSYSTGSAVYYMKANKGIVHGDLLSLCGKKTAVQMGNVIAAAVERLNDYCVAHGKPKTVMGQVPQASAVVLGVFAGRYDFALSDAVAYDELQKTAPHPLGTFYFPLRPKAYIGMIVKPDRKDHAHALLAALKAADKAGVYDKIWD